MFFNVTRGLSHSNLAVTCSFFVLKLLWIWIAIRVCIFLLKNHAHGTLRLIELIVLFIPIVLEIFLFELLFLGIIWTLEARRSFPPKFRADLCLNISASWRKSSWRRNALVRRIYKIWQHFLAFFSLSIIELSWNFFASTSFFILIVIGSLDINIMLHTFL